MKRKNKRRIKERKFLPTNKGIDRDILFGLGLALNRMELN